MDLPPGGADMTVVRLDSRALALLLSSEGGPVVRNLMVRATRVQTKAKAMAGKRSRNLENSIVKRTVRAGTQVYVEVGSELEYAYMHHEGTRPHAIFPRSARVLRFETPGGVVFAGSVNHPGTRPNRYLLDALDAAR